MKKLFGGIDLTWKKVIIAAIVLGVYTGIMAALPITRDTSFADISITFEWWILFGTLIIINSKSAKDSALKCFVFFLISQPLVYLVQVPFNKLGFQLFNYYPGWFKWTLLTVPMGFIGYYLKKDKWWGLFILTPVLAFLGIHYMGFLNSTLTYFPSHLLSSIFCLAVMIIFPLYIFKNKKIKYIGLIISIIIIAVTSFLGFTSDRNYYDTIILTSGGSEKVEFDDTYKVYFKDKNFGEIKIEYHESLDDYVVRVIFKKKGKTEFTIESPEGKKVTFKIDVKDRTYDLEKK